MKRALFAAVAALLLTGCKTTNTQDQRPQITVAGPVFPASRFKCGTKPVPPNPKTVGNKAASAGARYQGDLGYWGQRCANQLQSVETELRAAGQVAD